MVQIFIQLAQAVAGNVAAIVALLLVAAVIGYVTAWYYAKSIYTPVIKGLEEDNAELKKKVEGLKDDVIKLEGKIDKLNEKIVALQIQIDQKDIEIKHLKKPKKE